MIDRIFNYFFPKWDPKWTTGEYLLCKTAEFEDRVSRSTMVCKILERDKHTSKHYYRVITNDIPGLTDSQNKPIDFYIHEKNILGPVVNNS